VLPTLVFRTRNAAVIFVCLALGCGDDAGALDGAADGAREDAASDASPDTGRPPIPEGAFTVGTWNIEQLPKTEYTIGHVADVVREEEIDLLGVQEIVDPEDFATLADTAGYEDVITFGSTTLRVGFMYRPERVEVSEIERLFLDDWYAFPRAVLKARIVDLETGFDFIFLVLHLKALIDEESRMRRALAVEALDEWLTAALAAGGEQDYVVVGDYNDELTDGPEQNVFRPLLDAPERYRFLTLPIAEEGGYSFIPFDAMIDHVLVTTDALDEYGSGSTEVLPLELRIMYYEARVSDHRPVIARFVP
jgi:endonuclease/exonuclease/phosphatase family metal-dependent hydrolase